MSKRRGISEPLFFIHSSDNDEIESVDLLDRSNARFNLFVGSEWRNCGLDPYEFTIFCNLKSHANSQSKLCCPSIRTIAQETGISRPKVIQALRGLETKGFMRHIEQTKADGSKASHRYVDLAHPKMAKSENPASLKNQGVVNAVDHPGQCGAPGVVNVVDHKDINLKGETIDNSLSLQSERESPREREKTEGPQIRCAPAEKKDKEGATAPNQNNLSHAPSSSSVPTANVGATLRMPGPNSSDALRTGPAITLHEPDTDLMRPAAQCCTCDSKHPPGMPSLQEICDELRKLKGPSDESDGFWLAKEAEELHDVWLSIGFQMKSGPIRDWKASLRNWKRWRENGGADVFG
jgi:hypothetical protein